MSEEIVLVLKAAEEPRSHPLVGDTLCAPVDDGRDYLELGEFVSARKTEGGTELILRLPDSIEVLYERTHHVSECEQDDCPCYAAGMRSQMAGLADYRESAARALDELRDFLAREPGT